MDKYDLITTRYWKEFFDLKVHATYHSKYSEQSERIQKRIEYFLIAFSCGGIGGWALWEDHKTIWVILLGAVNLLTVLAPRLPYEHRIRGCEIGRAHV